MSLLKSVLKQRLKIVLNKIYIYTQKHIYVCVHTHIYIERDTHNLVFLYLSIKNSYIYLKYNQIQNLNYIMKN